MCSLSHVSHTAKTSKLFSLIRKEGSSKFSLIFKLLLLSNLYKLLTYQSRIRPILEYASPVWAGLPNYLRDEIERIQSRSLGILGLEKDYIERKKGRGN
jgi:hypothetical protein